MSNLINGSARLNKTYRLTMLAMFTAITLILAFVPNLGYITFIPTFSPTTMHIPVIVCAILMGPTDGAIIGFVFGITSVIQATFTQINPLFSPFVPFGSYKSAIIAIVPRILIGVFAAYTYRFIAKFDKTKFFACLSAAIIGSLTNTVLVLSGMFIFYKDYVATFASYYKVMAKNNTDITLKILGIIFTTNGIAEAIVAAILVTAIARALMVAMKKMKIA